MPRPRRESGTVWRKKRGGREYGSFYAYHGGRLMNLGTTVAEEARAAVDSLLGRPAAAPTPVGGAPVPHAPAAGAPLSNGARLSRPAYLNTWAAGGAPSAPMPGAAAPATPPPPAVLTPAMAGLADGMATALSRLNAVSLALACKHLAHVQPGKPDKSDLEALEKTWATGLRELFLVHGLQWWHILLAQNGALAMSMIQSGTAIPPKLSAPVVATVAPS